MAPKKHMKFGDDGTNVNIIKEKENLYERVVQKNLVKKKQKSFGRKVPSNGKFLGPVSIERLEDFQYGNISESDLKFQPSSGVEDLEESVGEEKEEDEEHEEGEIIIQNGKVNGDSNKLNGKVNKNINLNNTTNKTQQPKRKIVYYDDSEDEDLEDLPPPPPLPTSLKSLKYNLLNDRKHLPVYQAKLQIIKHLSSNDTTVLLAETGSGKSTQIPQLIYEYMGSKQSPQRIAITQPRRVAAINLATRVSQEMGYELGTKVGYSVRFQNKSSPQTHLKYLTDGMLLRELMMDHNLNKYTTIILDEAHERTVLTDLLMGLLKRLQITRRNSKQPLKLIIMSATLDAEKFSKFFDNAEILYIQGKMFPVQRFYVSKPVDDIVDSIVQTIVQINMSEQTGDILAFLAGQDEIDKSVDRLLSIANDLPKEAPLIVPVPLYASLPPLQQQKAFEKLPARRRKVILATNIAETSLTIPGVRYVVDSGLRKIRVWKPSLGLDTLFTTPISQASAAQRMGRAGREAPGKCYRLFTEKYYVENLKPQTEPEIVRCDISSTILILKKAGVDDIINFEWVQSPDRKAITSSLMKLYSLKALDDKGKITPLGEQMVLLPVSPHLAAVLIHAKEQSSSFFLTTIIDIVACLSIEDLMINPHPDKRDEINEKRRELFGASQEYGDLIMIKEMYNLYKKITDKRERKEWCKLLGINPRAIRNVSLVRQQLARYLKVPLDEEEENRSIDSDSIIKCFLRGFVSNSALGLPDRRYRTVLTGQMLSIHPSSTMFGRKVEAIMYIEYVFTSKAYARVVSPVQVEWLQEVAPQLLGRRNIGE